MAPRFHAPGWVRFTCTTCGDCCRGGDVLLAPGEAERLRALPWDDRDADLTGVEPAAGPRSQQRLARGADDACVFLGEDSLCRIHSRFGEAAKPLVCRSYPFSFQRLGEGFAVDCAHSCRAVSERRGEPVAANESSWTLLLADTAAAPEPRWQALAGRRVDAPLLVEIEQPLVDLLRDRTLPPATRTACAVEYARLALSGDPSTPAAAALRDAIPRGLRAGAAARRPPEPLDATQRAVFFQWLFLALNPVRASFAELPARDQERERRVRIDAGNRWQRREAHPWIAGRELGVSFERIAAQPSGELAGRGAEPVMDWLAAKVVGQRFLWGGTALLPVAEATPKLLLHHPMALWTAKALSADRGAPAVEDEDVTRAIRLLDRTLGLVGTSSLPKKVARACDFVLLETDVVAAALGDVLAGRA